MNPKLYQLRLKKIILNLGNRYPNYTKSNYHDF